MSIDDFADRLKYDERSLRIFDEMVRAKPELEAMYWNTYQIEASVSDIYDYACGNRDARRNFTRSIMSDWYSDDNDQIRELWDRKFGTELVSHHERLRKIVNEATKGE